MEVTSFPETSTLTYQCRRSMYQNTWKLTMTNFECPIVILISNIARDVPTFVNNIVSLKSLQFLLDFLWWYFFIYTLVRQFNPTAPVIPKIITRKISSNFVPILPARISTFQVAVSTFERHLTRSGSAADPLKYFLHKISVQKNRSSSKNSCKLWNFKKFKNNIFFLKQTIHNTPLTLYKGVRLTVNYIATAIWNIFLNSMLISNHSFLFTTSEA
jgi:hypothetical protein